MNQKYFGKLLLFGEYTIIHGSLALAIPYPNFYGQWSMDSTSADRDKIESSRRVLKEMLIHFKSHDFGDLLDLDTFEQDLAEGLWFDSNIPQGYGCGSSGALSAAIYDSYSANKSEDTQTLKVQLSKVEHFFHGQSSGVDPLVCYLNRAILIEADNVQVVESTPSCTGNGLDFFLIDTKISRKTTALVQHYLAAAESADFQKECILPLKEVNAKAISEFLSEDQDLWSSFRQISELEYQYFQQMIPEAFKGVWSNGLGSSDYYLKLCGAGGGGFILGLTRDWEETQKQLNDFELVKIMGG